MSGVTLGQEGGAAATRALPSHLETGRWPGAPGPEDTRVDAAAAARPQVNLVFLFPGIWRPLKTDFAAKFRLLSERCTGFVFTLANTRHRDVAIGGFRLWSERIGPTPFVGWLKRFWVQVVLPIRLLWGRHRVDAIIAYDPFISSVTGIVLKLVLRTKLVVEVNGDYQWWTDPSSRLPKRSLTRLLLHASLRCADAVKVLNRAQEGFVKRRFPAKPVYRFPNFVASDYLQSLECHQGDYLLSVGSPFHRKGMDVLIRAFRLLGRDHPTVKLRIMGFAPAEELMAYKQLAHGQPRIEFVDPGWIEDVGEQMSGCYAFVSAARSEAQGRVLFEAMACRKPVVATRTNGALEYIQDGRTGLLCEIDDPEDLARTLDSLLSAPGLAAQMGQAGFERLRAEFSPGRYAESLLSMLEDVIDGRRCSTR